MILQLPSLIGTQPAMECIGEAAGTTSQPCGELFGDFAPRATNALLGCCKLQRDFFQQAGAHCQGRIVLAGMKQGAEAIELARMSSRTSCNASQSSNTAMTNCMFL